MLRRASLPTFAIAVLLAVAPRPGAATPCDDLATLSLPQGTVTSATAVPAGPFVPPDTAAAVDVPAFCRVKVTLTPTSDSVIHDEVWLPDAWNGKLDAAGNGGYGGSYATPAAFMVVAVRRGYATAASDMGHSAALAPPGVWALGHPEKIADWAFRASHLTAETAKAVIRAYYGRGPRLSYFTGCSDGGHEGFMEAQRYPGDYDGIVAGAPANYWTHQSAAWVWEEERAASDNPAAIVPLSKLQMITDAAVAACDALDGVVDGLIEDPRRCAFDPATLQCAGADAPTCLTAAQVQAIREIYAGPRNPRTGRSIYPGLERGGEFNWPGDRGALGRGFYTFMVFENPAWDFNTLDFDHDIAYADAKMAATIDSTSPDLSDFRALGGKMIIYHGWDDARVNPRNTLHYFDAVADALHGRRRPAEDARGPARQVQQFLRIFMAPGMTHCAGGPGLNTFDTLTALEDWVEKGLAPDRLLATHSTLALGYNVSTSATGASFTRPLCPHPQVARWKGTGSTSDAANFDCVWPESDRD